MHLLGIDLGDKRTGLAVADADFDIASPLKTIEISISRDAELASAIALEVRDQGASRVVIGLPLNMDDGSEGPQAKKVRAFGERLARELEGIEIVFHDERLTSEQADWEMSRSGLTHKQKKARRDALAAAAILRDYLGSLGGSS